MPARQEPLPADALDAVVRLLFEATDDPDDPFYDRICEAACTLTGLERAILLLYDPGRRLVLPVGSDGVEPELLAHMYGTLDETPIAQRALTEGDVVESSDLPREVPQRYAGLPGVTKLACTPVAAGGHWLGVMFADCGGGDFTLSDSDRQTMRALGRTAALATHVREATVQRERGTLLLERVGLARDVHERVMQRLFGVSLALGAHEGELGAEERARCAGEVSNALAELRDALTRSLDPIGEASRATLRDELDRLGQQFKDLPLRVEWEPDAEVPAGLEPLAVSVLGEALRNVEKHSTTDEVRVAVRSGDGAFSLEVRNAGLLDDDAGADGPGAGIGLRLASYEAMQRGGVLEFGREGEEWRVRLVLPVSGWHGVSEAVAS